MEALGNFLSVLPLTLSGVLISLTALPLALPGALKEVQKRILLNVRLLLVIGMGLRTLSLIRGACQS